MIKKVIYGNKIVKIKMNKIRTIVSKSILWFRYWYNYFNYNRVRVERSLYGHMVNVD